jgi:hypothetical protein
MDGLAPYICDQVCLPKLQQLTVYQRQDQIQGFTFLGLMGVGTIPFQNETRKQLARMTYQKSYNIIKMAIKLNYQIFTTSQRYVTLSMLSHSCWRTRFSIRL